MSRTRECAQDQVTIVSRNAETLHGLQTYLHGAGVAARCTSDLDECMTLAPATTLAFVLFPDDFRWEKVIATLADVAARRPEALPVLVTAHPNRFQELTSEDVLIVPRPVWGWTILDALRAHRERRQSTRRKPTRGGRTRAR